MSAQSLYGRVLTIRADADPEMGTGHFMRSLALGQAWRDAGGRVLFVSCSSHESLIRRLEKERFAFHRISARHPDEKDLRETLSLSRKEGSVWVSLDGYFFDSRYHQRVAESGLRLIVIDDNAHLDSYDVDVLLNQNLHADSLQYKTRRDTTRLLGTSYVLLRKEFLERSRSPREVPEVARRILVTLGGSDPGNMSLQVLEVLARLPISDVDGIVISGPDNLALDALHRKVEQIHVRVRIESDPSDMPGLLSWAELALSGGGSTLWELAFMGVPTIAFIMAENQAKAVAALESRGLVRSVREADRSGDLERIVEGLARDRATREQMSRAGRELVDGMGVKRVLKTLAALE